MFPLMWSSLLSVIELTVTLPSTSPLIVLFWWLLRLTSTLFSCVAPAAR